MNQSKGPKMVRRMIIEETQTKTEATFDTFWLIPQYQMSANLQLARHSGRNPETAADKESVIEKRFER